MTGFWGALQRTQYQNSETLFVDQSCSLYLLRIETTERSDVFAEAIKHRF
jgi:hypothetical protein